MARAIILRIYSLNCEPYFFLCIPEPDDSGSVCFHYFECQILEIRLAFYDIFQGAFYFLSLTFRHGRTCQDVILRHGVVMYTELSSISIEPYLECLRDVFYLGRALNDQRYVIISDELGRRGVLFLAPRQ